MLREIMLFSLSFAMLLGSGIAFNFDIRQFATSAATEIAIELIIFLCVFGWLPTLITAIVLLRRKAHIK